MNYKELNSAFKRINNWYNKKTKVLSIKTRPFNTAIVFSSVINNVLTTNGKILYVWCCSNKEKISKRKKEYYNLLIENKEKSNLEKNIVFINVDELIGINEEFDLVIFDDITIFSDISKERVRESIEEVYWRSRKIIVYTSEDVFPIGEKMTLSYLIDKFPMAEPRLLSTRIKLEEDIPMALYDYFKWFKTNNKKALIVVPSEEKLNKVYNHYYYILKKEDIRVVKYMKNQNFSFIEDIIENYKESLFIITNNIGEYIKSIDDLNIVILFADDEYYDYKSLIYLSGCIKVTTDFLPEILLVSKDVSDNMDIVKSMARRFNKSLWEKRSSKK